MMTLLSAPPEAKYAPSLLHDTQCTCGTFKLIRKKRLKIAGSAPPHLVLVSLERVQLLSRAGVEDKHARAARRGEIVAVGAVGDVINDALQAIFVWVLQLPCRENAHLRERCQRG